MEPLTQPVLVGVTGPGENTDALRFAIAEARALGGGITLVHAVHPPLPPPPPSILITDDTWSEVGHSIVAEVRRELSGLLGDDPVPSSAVVHQGPPGQVFAELSKQASRIVLQHRDLSSLHRLVTGPTVASVAAHAHCPVVSVPSRHSDRPVTGVVSAGVFGDGGPPQVLEAAFAEAATRHASLRLVRAWRLPPSYDDLVQDVARWTADDEAAVTAAAADLRSKYPDVAVEVDVQHDWPADVLVRTAATSDMLVVGRHSGLPHLPPRLGSLARTTVMHAECPVMVVPLD